MMDPSHALDRRATAPHGRDRRRRLLAAGGLAVAWSALGFAFTARPAPEVLTTQTGPSAAPTVTVRFVAQATANRATGSFRTQRQDEVPVGGRAAGHLTAGTAAQPNLCMLGTAAPTPSEPAWVWWQAALTVRAVDADEVSLSLEWHRHGLPPIEDAGWSIPKDVRLREGQSHIFDAVVGSPVGTTGCSNVLVSIEVAVNRPGDEARALLEYQLTLVNERAATRWVSPRLDLVGRPAAAVPFRFRPVRWPITADDTTDGAPAVEMDILGEVTGVLRRDGSVDVTTRIARRLMLARFHEGSGRLTFTARLGEEVRVLLPPPSGSTLWRWTDPGAAVRPFRPGVEVERDGVRVHYGEFLGDVETSLVLRVDRVR